MKVAVIIANGTEELEALTPIDVLRRAGVIVETISVSGEFVNCSHNVIIKADKCVKDANLSEFDGIVIPGGMPGATNISECKKVISSIKTLLEENKLVASICASPAVVLSKHNLIDGKSVTCYPAPDFIKMLNNCKYQENNVVVDGNLITANGPKSAFDFSLAICDFLGVTPKF